MYRDDAEARRRLQDARTRCHVGDEPCPNTWSPQPLSTASAVWIALGTVLSALLALPYLAYVEHDHDGCCSREALTKVRVDKIASEWYGRWSVTTAMDSDCPADLVELARVVGGGEDDVRDPWGTPLRMRCSPAPDADIPFGVASAGPDRIFGSADDLVSWRPRDRR